MNKLQALLNRKDDSQVDFHFVLIAEDIGEVPISGKVYKSDSREWHNASVDAKRKWAEGKIKADDFAPTLVCEIVSDCKVDGEPVSKEDLFKLLVKYPSLQEKIDMESTSKSVFMVKPQSESLNTQSGKRGSTSQRQKTAK